MEYKQSKLIFPSFLPLSLSLSIYIYIYIVLTAYKTHPNFSRANQEKNKVLILNVMKLI